MIAELRISDMALAFELGAGGGAELDSELLPAVAYRDPNPYPGPYTVTPALRDIVLATRGHSMTNDLTVEEIPVHRVSNPAGGVTVSIGG